MKTVTITCFNRPQYLEKTIESLFKNDLSSYSYLYCSLEPSKELRKNIDLLNSINFIDKEIIINNQIEGVRNNPYKILDKVFGDGSEFNVYLEDDIILSPDAFDLANFYYDYFKDEEYLLCSFYNDMRRYELEYISEVIEWENFVAIGFALFRSSWYKWFKRFWFDDRISREENIGGIGWDWSIRAMMKRYDLKSVTPCIPRSTHIGKQGTYCTPMENVRLFGDKIYCNERVANFYKNGLNMMKIVRNCYENKLCDVLKEQKEGSKICILFNHGLGDFVNFLPLFDSIVKFYPKFKFNIGFNCDRNFVYLHPKGLLIESPYGKYENQFDLMIGIQYPEPPRTPLLVKYYTDLGIQNVENITKPELCNEMEIGLQDFKWEPYELEINLDENSKRIGVHFFGNMLSDKKDVSIDNARKIWNEIIKAGFEPYEIHMIPIDDLNNQEVDFINRDNSLRYQFPNIRVMSEAIAKCKYFIGIDSGPLYLAGSILGLDSCIGLEKNLEFAKVLPYDISLVDVNNYEDDSIFVLLKDL